jgi:3-dehydroquinate synthetase
VKEGKIRFVLAEEIGKVFISSRVRESDLLALWE